MDDRTFDGFPEDSPIPILYLPSDPRISCYGPEALTDASGKSYLPGWLAIAVGVIGLVAEAIAVVYKRIRPDAEDSDVKT